MERLGKHLPSHVSRLKSDYQRIKSNHGFDRTLKLVSSRREESEADDGKVSM